MGNKIKKAALAALAVWYLGAPVSAQENQDQPVAIASDRHPVEVIFSRFQQDQNVQFSPELESLVSGRSVLSETEEQMLGHYRRTLQTTDQINPDMLRIITAYDGAIEFSYATDAARTAGAPHLEKRLQSVTIQFLRESDAALDKGKKKLNELTRESDLSTPEPTTSVKKSTPNLKSQIPIVTEQPVPSTEPEPLGPQSAHTTEQAQTVQPTPQTFDFDPLSSLLASYIQGKDVEFDPALKPVFDDPKGYSLNKVEYKGEKLGLNEMQLINRIAILSRVRKLDKKSPQYATELANVLNGLHKELLAQGKRGPSKGTQNQEAIAALLAGFIHKHYEKRRNLSAEAQGIARLYEKFENNPYVHFGKDIERLIEIEELDKLDKNIPGTKKRFVEAVQRKREDVYDQLKSEIFSGTFTMARFKELTAEGAIFHIIHKKGNAATIMYLEGKYGPTAKTTIDELRGGLPVEVLERRFKSLENFMYTSPAQIGRRITPAVPSLYTAAHALATRAEREGKK